MYSIGVDLGGTNIAVGIVDENYKIINKGSCPTKASRDGDAIIFDMAELCKKLVLGAGLSMSDIGSAGIASPGTVNPETGVVEYANNIRFTDFPIAEFFSKYTGIPKDKIAVGNDANLAAYGEYVAGSAADAKSSVMITLGTGVGSGIIIDGKILTGCAYGGAELGHMVIVYDGRPCTCGRNGCLESYASATALITMTKEKFAAEKDTLMHEICGNDINRVGGKTAFEAMRKGDKAGAEVVNAYIGYLSCGIANILNAFQPDVISIGGGVSNEGDNLMIPLIEKVKSQVYSKDHTLKTKIRVASLGNDAGIIGAAALAMTK